MQKKGRKLASVGDFKFISIPSAQLVFEPNLFIFTAINSKCSHQNWRGE